MSLLLAYGLSLVTIVLVYHGLYRFLKLLYKRSPIWAVSFLVFVSPFAYIVVHVGSFLDLMWVLLLTPFYGVAIMTILFTTWMIRFYSISFSILALLHYMFQRKRFNLLFFDNQASFEVFWDDNGKTRVRALTSEKKLKRQREHGKLSFVKGLRKYLNVVLIAFLACALAATLVGNAEVAVRNPTFQEAMQFVKADLTDENRYDESHACVRFATDFRNNALKAGYNCGYVIVYFPDGSSHALNSFNTVDKGLIFVEPQLDTIVTLTIGQPYWNRTRYAAPDYDDTIIGYTITW